jgi:hypothetical protein
MVEEANYRKLVTWVFEPVTVRNLKNILFQRQLFLYWLLNRLLFQLAELIYVQTLRGVKFVYIITFLTKCTI